FDDARVRRAGPPPPPPRGDPPGGGGGGGGGGPSPPPPPPPRPPPPPVPPLLWQHDSTAGRDLGHDPAAARRLLAEAGFTDADGDGVVERDGRPFRFTLQVPHGYREGGDIAQIVQGDRRRVGIAAQVQEVEFNSLLGRASDPRERDFDALVLGWKPEFRVDDSDLFACAKRDHPMHFSGSWTPSASSPTARRRARSGSATSTASPPTSRSRSSTSPIGCRGCRAACRARRQMHGGIGWGWRDGGFYLRRG